MTLSFALPGTLPSPLSRCDPRWKLASFALAGLGVACLRTLPASTIALLGALALVLVARLPLRWCLVRLSGVALFLALFAIFLPFTLDGGEMIALGPLTLSLPGSKLAAVVLAKGLALATLVIVLIGTGPFEDLMKAAQRLHVPGLVVQVVLMTYRYVHLLREELGRLRVSLRVRGFRNRASLHSYRTIGQVTGTLLVRGHERAERVGQAMRCRGFDGCFRSLTDFVTRPADVALAVAVTACAGSLVVWDIFLR